ncbi:peptidoglycan-binding protein [Pedobacter sp. R20-19]|uniref:peptidoglycan-binding protein n=1 Tax=Pedobacter sp. R20-19 TaxID=1270196 RepID=UPI001E5FA0EE|nr:peptidoglycan-binding protein [Pedobacter sp. R20-19]
MATIRILLGIICLVFTGGHCVFSSSILAKAFVDGEKHTVVIGRGSSKIRIGKLCGVEKSFGLFTNSATVISVQQRIITIAQSQIGVREATGHNDGRQIEAYLHYTGLKKGNPWCAAFVSWVFGQAGFCQPVTAWSPNLFPIKRRTTNIGPATIFGVYFPSLKRIAHCGLVAQKNGHWLITIEGNTNMDGSREGNGVHRKRRLVQSIKLFADWIKQEGGDHAHR